MANDKSLTVKYPLYVAAYEILLKDIQAGVYKPGDRLPGENQLSAQMKISRGTLRQAMLLLQEDGIIANYQGKGNFVLANVDMTRRSLEKLDNPLTSFALMPVEETETFIEIRKTSQKHQEIFKIDASKLLIMIGIVYKSGGKAIGMALAFMPYDLMAEHKVDLHDMDAVYAFYNECMAIEGLTSQSVIKLAYARAPVTLKMNIEDDCLLFMMDEKVYSETGQTVLTQKLFFLPDAYEFVITRKNDRILSKVL